MPITFKPLWKLLIDRDMTKEDRHIAAELSASTTAKMGKDGNVALEGLARIWTELGCRVEQVTEMTEVNREEGEHDE